MAHARNIVLLIADSKRYFVVMTGNNASLAEQNPANPKNTPFRFRQTCAA
jgi:isochorismate hydrolase